MSRNLIRLFGFFVAVFFGIAGCGGGSSGTTAPTTPTTSGVATPGATTPTTPGNVSALTVSGTASEGKLITGKTVKLKDANGTSAVDGTTNATTGIYSIDVTGLTAPFLVTVTGTNGTYVSLAQTTGTANINPITTIIVALAAGNPDVAALFTNLTTTQINTINGNYTAKRVLVATSLQSVLPAGVQMQDYFTGTITAGTGMDALFDTHQITVDPAAGITVKTKGAGATTVLTIPAAAVTANIGSLLAGTVLDSPVLAALASKYGQTSRATLDSLSATDLEQVVRASFAVAADLSALSPASVAADPVIQSALRIGIPIVFENKAALTAYLSSLTGLPGGSSTADLEAAAAAMTAAIGLGVQSQIAIVQPSTVSADLIGVTEIFSLGAGANQSSLPTGTLDIGTGSQAATTDINKLLLPSKAAPPLTGPAELLTMIESAISQGRLSQSSVARVSANLAPKRSALAVAAAAATKPALVTQKDFLIRWPEYAWRPRDRQNFVIQNALRIQMFQGSGGQKKYVRLLVDDSDNTTGFMNRDWLFFNETSDKGYFIGGTEVQLVPSVDWLNFGGREPGYVDAQQPGDCWAWSTYTPGMANSDMSFDIDYVESGVKKIWTSREVREFQMDEFQCRTYQNNGSQADWRWTLDLVGEGCRRLDSGGGDPDWKKMSENDAGEGNANRITSPMDISLGTNQKSLHPKVQAWFWVPATETRTANINMRQTQEVWNVWSEYKAPWYSVDYRNVYSATIDRGISVDFNKMSTSTAIWATGTSGNPGAYKEMQGDGNLVIHAKDGRVLWASGTGGQSGHFEEKMQDDGNLVVNKWNPIWASGTSGNPGATLNMQSDGNLVIYTQAGKPIWATGTSGNPGAYKDMQGDGNLVIKAQGGRALWASGTGGRSGTFVDKMQSDGNYVIYSLEPIWNSATFGNPGATAVMQSDGNYVIYTKK